MATGRPSFLHAFIYVVAHAHGGRLQTAVTVAAS